MTADVYLTQFDKVDIDKALSFDRCDKTDYLIATGCGVIGGIVDVIVGTINAENAVSNFTDRQIDNAVQKFAEKCGWEHSDGEALDSTHSAIKWLEKRYKVNYDQSVGDAAQEIFDLYPKNHHIKSLAHSPDPIGLFFSIIDQFTGTSHFYSPDGKLMIMNTQTMELEGKTVKAKIFAGIVNWFGHLVSDAAGSSTSKGRGMGLPIPFFNLIELCNFGKFNVNDDVLTIADIGTRVYTNGYDLRHGITLSIPVLITELSIRFCWALRRHFQFKSPITQCIPTEDHDSLRLMLLVGYGCFCTVDAADAGIKSGGNVIVFVAHLNIIAWLRLSVLGIKQIYSMLGMNIDVNKEVETIKRLNTVLDNELAVVTGLDLQKANNETESYINACNRIRSSNSIYELNDTLKMIYTELDYELPWEGDFEDFINDPNKHWHFG